MLVDLKRKIKVVMIADFVVEKKSFFTLRLRFINFNDEPLIAVEIFVVPLNDMRYLSMTILGAT